MWVRIVKDYGVHLEPSFSKYFEGKGLKRTLTINVYREEEGGKKYDFLVLFFFWKGFCQFLLINGKNGDKMGAFSPFDTFAF